MFVRNQLKFTKKTWQIETGQTCYSLVDWRFGRERYRTSIFPRQIPPINHGLCALETVDMEELNLPNVMMK